MLLNCCAGQAPGLGTDASVLAPRPIPCDAPSVQEEIEQYFHLPSEEACKQLRVGLTILKRLCRRFGIERWPYRRAGKGGSKVADTKQPASPPCSSSSGGGSASGGSSSSAPKQQQQHSSSAHTTGGSGASAATTRQSTDCGTTIGSLQRAGSDRLTVECNGLQRVGSLKRGRSTEVASALPLAATLRIASPATAAAAAAGTGFLQQQPWATRAAAEADLLADELGAHHLMQSSSLKKRKSLELAGDALDQALLLEQVAATAPAERLRSGLSAASLLRASSTPVQLALERRARQPSTPLTALPLRRADANAALQVPGQRLPPEPLRHVEGGLASGASREAVAHWQEQQLAALTALVTTKNPQAASLPETQGSSMPAAQRGLTLSASDAMLASFTDPSPRSPGSQPQLSGITTDSGCLLHNASDSGGKDPLGWDRGEGALGTPQSLLSPTTRHPPPTGAPMLASGTLPAAPPAAATPPQPGACAAVPALGLSDPGDQDLVSPFSLVNQDVKPGETGDAEGGGFVRPRPSRRCPAVRTACSCCPSLNG